MRDPYYDRDDDETPLERFGSLWGWARLLFLTGFIAVAWLIAAHGWVLLGALFWIALSCYFAFKVAQKWRERA